MKGQKLRNVIILTCILSPVGVVADGLFEIYQSALKNDPVYLAEFHKKKASEEVINQARAVWLPQISGNITHSQVRQNIIQTDNTVFASGETGFPTTNYRAEIRQSVVNYSNFFAVKQANATVKRYAAEFTATEQDLMRRVSERYFAVLAASEGVEYIESEKESVLRQYDLVKAKVDRGLANSVDYQDAQARLLQVNSREIELRNALENSKADLKAIIGTLPDSLLLMTREIPLSTPVPNDTQEWVNSAYDQNPSIIAKRFEQEEAKKEIERQRGGYMPTLDIIGSYNKNDTGGTLFGGGSEVDTQQIMLELNVPLFKGGLTSSRLHEAVEIHSKVTEELNAMMREAERTIVTAFNGVNNAIAKVESLQKLVEASDAVVRLKVTAYNSGLASSLDVLDASRNLYFARSELARARFEYIINTVLLKRAAGLLEESDLGEINNRMLSTSDKLSLF